jgi:hypothetical protein
MESPVNVYSQIELGGLDGGFEFRDRLDYNPDENGIVIENNETLSAGTGDHLKSNLSGWNDSHMNPPNETLCFSNKNNYGLQSQTSRKTFHKKSESWAFTSGNWQNVSQPQDSSHKFRPAFSKLPEDAIKPKNQEATDFYRKSTVYGEYLQNLSSQSKSGPGGPQKFAHKLANITQHKNS